MVYARLWYTLKTGVMAAGNLALPSQKQNNNYAYAK